MELNEVLKTIFQVVIIPLLSVLTGFAVKWINAKANEIKERTSNAYAQKYIDRLKDLVTSAVIAVNQTYVDALKEKDAFTKEAQEEAFRRVYEAVLLQMTEEAHLCLSEVIGDFNSYLTNLIEEEVNLCKIIEK